MKVTQTTSPRTDAAAPEETHSANRFLRNLKRTLIYRTGVLALYHRLRSRRTLTVVMFHRVLSRDDPRWETSLAP